MKRTLGTFLILALVFLARQSVADPKNNPRALTIRTERAP